MVILASLLSFFQHSQPFGPMYKLGGHNEEFNPYGVAAAAILVRPPTPETAHRSSPQIPAHHTHTHTHTHPHTPVHKS